MDKQRRHEAHEARINSRGRLTVPKPVRETLGIEDGGEVRFFLHKREARMVAVRPVHRLFGSMPYDGPPASQEDFDRVIVEGHIEGNLGPDESDA